MFMNYLYPDSDAFDGFFLKQYVEKKPVGFSIIDGGVIVPFGCDSGEGGCRLANFTCDYIDEEVVYIGDFTTGHYGNFLIDNLSRFWYVLKYKPLCKLAYIRKDFTFDSKPWSREIIHYLGLKCDAFLDIRKPTKFKRVIVPEKSFSHDQYVFNEYKLIFEAMYKAMETEKFHVYEKVYLTRTMLDMKKEVGEKLFERFFQMNGFQIVSPEKLTIAEQAFILRNCKEVASIEGTHAHNIVFKANSGIRYHQIILRKQSECIPRQMQLNQITNGEVTWIDVWREPFGNFPITHDRGPFLIEWNDNVEKFARDNNMVIPDINHFIVYMNRALYCWKCLLYWCKHNAKKVVYALKYKR